MKIAFVAKQADLPWGGCEELWSQTALRALEAGHQVFASVYDWPVVPERLERLRAAGAVIDRRRRSTGLLPSALARRLVPPFARLAGFGPDVVCVNQGGTYDVARGEEMASLWRIERAAGWPYVLLCHAEQPAPSPRTCRKAQRLFARAAGVGFLGEGLRRASEAHLGGPIPTARTFQNPLTAGPPEALAWRDGADLRLLFVGRLDAVKGADLALEALARPAWRERAWRLTVAGEGPERERLEAQAAACGIADRVAFLGFVADVRALWRGHDALVLPSRAEGLPLAILEAMLLARPVVATRVGCVEEWVEDGVHGFLVARPEAAAVGEALERLWQGRHDLEPMGRAAFAQATALRQPDPIGALLAWLVAAGRR